MVFKKEEGGGVLESDTKELLVSILFWDQVLTCYKNNNINRGVLMNPNIHLNAISGVLIRD